jgi:hypothetical protein
LAELVEALSSFPSRWKKRAALRQAQRSGIFLVLLLAGCVPSAPVSVSGVLPTAKTSYTVLGDEDWPGATRMALGHGLSALGMVPVGADQKPDRLIVLTLADRPRTVGATTATVLPTSRTAPGWIDRPVREGWLCKGRRDVRLTIRFISPDGALREERVVRQELSRRAPAADMARLIEAAMRP